MARIGIGILLTKSEWSELVLVFYWCPKVANAQPWTVWYADFQNIPFTNTPNIQGVPQNIYH